MCNITRPFKGKKQVVGYKVVLVHKDRFYSPSSGIEYKVGKVEIPAVHAKPPCGWCDNSHNPNNKFYRENYKGLTAVVSRKASEEILEEWLDGGIKHCPTTTLNGEAFDVRLGIARIRLGGVRYVGSHWERHKTHLGSIIREIELVVK